MQTIYIYLHSKQNILANDIQNTVSTFLKINNQKT